MRTTHARLTVKGQMTVPKEAREALGVRPGDEVEMTVVRSFLVVQPRPKTKDPVEFLCSQVHANVDAVKAIRRIREEL